MSQQAGDEHLVQRLHAADAGALGRGDVRRVDGLHQLSWGKAGGDERVDGGD